MSVATEVDLRALAERGAAELGPDAPAEQVLAWAAETFGVRRIVASNMQNAVLVDLAARALPGVEILFLETGYHFAETIGTRDAVEHVYDVKIVNARARRSVAAQDIEFGKDLFARDPNLCCAMRKVEPLTDTLSGYDAWVTGVRRVEAPTRANTPLVTYDEKFGLVKLNPLAAWSDDDMERYIAELKSVPLAQGFDEVVYPGEIEARNDARNRVAGLHLPEDTLADLRKLGAEYTIDLPSSI